MRGRNSSTSPLWQAKLICQMINERQNPTIIATTPRSVRFCLLTGQLGFAERLNSRVTTPNTIISVPIRPNTAELVERTKLKIEKAASVVNPAMRSLFLALIMPRPQKNIAVKNANQKIMNAAISIRLNLSAPRSLYRIYDSNHS